MKKTIEVARVNVYGRLDLAILDSLVEEGVLENEEYIDEKYEINFARKNGRSNGKQMAILTQKYGHKVLKAYWLTDVERMNTWQKCNLTEMSVDEIEAAVQKTRFEL